MAVVPMKKLSEAERRGKLAAEEMGQFVFSDPDDYVETLRSLVRSSGLSDKAISEASDGLIKSPQTIHNLTEGRFDRDTGSFKQTKNPTLRTTIGYGPALNMAVAFIPRGKK